MEPSEQQSRRKKCLFNASLMARRVVQGLKELVGYKRRKCCDIATSICGYTSNKPPTSLLAMPAEILRSMFTYLAPADVSRLSRVCQRLNAVCREHRHHLPRRSIEIISVQYGEWHDVLKSRHIRVSDEQPIRYSLSEPVHRRGARCRLFRCRKKPRLNQVVDNCQFETLVVSIQMINADLRAAIPFSSIAVKHVILNCTHPSLLPSKLLNYLPAVCADLCTNRIVAKVDFVFAKLDTHLKELIVNSKLRVVKHVSILLIDKL